MTRVRIPGYGAAMHCRRNVECAERDERLVRGDVFRRSQGLLRDAIRGQAGVTNFVQQRTVADAQRTRGLLAVPMAVLQNFQNDFALQFAHGLARELLQRDLSVDRNFGVEEVRGDAA